MNIGNVSKNTQNAQTDASEQYMIFEIGGEIYGVTVHRVREIRAWLKTTPLPEPPAFVKGIIDLRGVVVPIYDLKLRFTGDPIDILPTTVVMVIQLRGGLVGIVVDQVTDIQRIPRAEIKSIYRTDSNPHSEFLLGVAHIQDRLIGLIDLDALFADQPEVHALSEDPTADELSRI